MAWPVSKWETNMQCFNWSQQIHSMHAWFIITVNEYSYRLAVWPRLIIYTFIECDLTSLAASGHKFCQFSRPVLVRPDQFWLPSLICPDQIWATKSGPPRPLAFWPRSKFLLHNTSLMWYVFIVWNHFWPVQPNLGINV